jgi:hypothetical protein
MTAGNVSTKLQAARAGGNATDLPATTEVIADGQARVSARAGGVLRVGQRRFWRDALRRRMLAAGDLIAILVTAGALAL